MMFGTCGYSQLAQRYVNHFGMESKYFRSQFNMCYCDLCHKNRGDKLQYIRGNPPQTYQLPLDWVRFAMIVPAEKNKQFELWHRAFHGTEEKSVVSIVKHGLVRPDELTPDGRLITERRGHYHDGRKPVGFDTKKIFVTPSYIYAGHDVYAYPAEYNDINTGMKYAVRTCFQVLIRPGGYGIAPQTELIEDDQIDPCFKNEELEWSTKKKSDLTLYGLMIKLEKK